MKMNELLEDGRIVKGVNTTVDVGPNEIKTQAAKFGNTVTKDGVPPTLSSKVKGSSTNVLYNLGLTEGYKLQLERDKHMLVLNITNTETGRRTEVRGKPGYESGNYDPNDDLHQLLDTIGKSANISELINGEVVTINPKHPDAEKAKAATHKAYSEARYTAAEWAIIEGGHTLEETPKKRSDLYAQMENFADGKIKYKTPDFDRAWEEARAFQPQQSPLQDLVKEYLFFTSMGQMGTQDGAKSTDSKDKINEVLRTLAQSNKNLQNLDKQTLEANRDKILNHIHDMMKYAISHFREHLRPEYFDTKKKQINSVLTKYNAAASTNENFSENFADGKVKGKSRPGRVKRAGASCNGSVTDLRKRAKNSSGEKAKMLNWCANMKSGRQKK